MKDETLSLEEIARRRKEQEARDKKKLEKQSLALARRFEEGISVLGAKEDDLGRKKINKEKFLEVLTYDIDNVGSEEEYTPSELDYLKRSLSKLSAGSGSSLALMCTGGDTCPFASKCPWVTIKHEPRGKPCPIETVLFTEFLVRYMEELGVDPSNMMELSYCNELAETEILLIRLNKMFSQADNAKLVYMQPVMSKSGEVMDQMVVSPLLEARDRLVKRRERIIKLMVGDRQEKYKEASARKIKDNNDISVQQAKKRAMIIEAQIAKEITEKDQVEEDVLTPDDIFKEDEVSQTDGGTWVKEPWEK